MSCKYSSGIVRPPQHSSDKRCQPLRKWTTQDNDAGRFATNFPTLRPHHYVQDPGRSLHRYEVMSDVRATMFRFEFRFNRYPAYSSRFSFALAITYKPGSTVCGTAADAGRGRGATQKWVNKTGHTNNPRSAWQFKFKQKWPVTYWMLISASWERTALSRFPTQKSRPYKD